MEDDKLAFLDDELEAPEAEAETPEVAGEPEQEKAEEAPEAAEQPAEAESKGDDKEAAPPAASEEKQAGYVPLAALLDEREKRQKMEREAEELRRWRQQFEAEASQKKPDFYDNPEAALQQVQHQTQHMLVAEKLRQSRFFAEREYGQELVNEAYAYFDQHPEQSHALLNEPSPFHAAVEHYKRQKAIAEIGTDPEAYKAKIRAELEAELAKRAPPKPAAPPRSLASAPSAGGEAQPSGSAFDELFG